MKNYKKQTSIFIAIFMTLYKFLITLTLLYSDEVGWAIIGIFQLLFFSFSLFLFFFSLKSIPIHKYLKHNGKKEAFINQSVIIISINSLFSFFNYYYFDLLILKKLKIISFIAIPVLFIFIFIIGSSVNRWINTIDSRYK